MYARSFSLRVNLITPCFADKNAALSRIVRNTSRNNYTVIKIDNDRNNYFIVYNNQLTRFLLFYYVIIDSHYILIPTMAKAKYRNGYWVGAC